MQGFHYQTQATSLIFSAVSMLFILEMCPMAYLIGILIFVAHSSTWFAEHPIISCVIG